MSWHLLIAAGKPRLPEWLRVIQENFGNDNSVPRLLMTLAVLVAIRYKDSYGPGLGLEFQPRLFGESLQLHQGAAALEQRAFSIAHRFTREEHPERSGQLQAVSQREIE